ncbi:unnamed protein product [Orchesella dallaii]|uniref:Uncharacterized protein n=1 Tax=Orchesella dallaii TaxID=48710 RepID=A0ABP1Q5Q8_9HEXA
MAQNLWKWDSSEESDIEEDVHSPPPKQKKTSAHAEVTGEAVENPPISDALSNLQFNPGSSSSMENGEAKPKSSTSTDEFESTRSNPKKNVKSTQTAQDSQPQSKINANPTLKSATPAPITTPQLENRVVAAPDDPSTPSKWVSPFKLSKHELSNSTWFPYTATKGRVRGTGQPPRQTSAVANYQSRYVDYGTNNYLQPIRSPFRVPLPTQKQAYAEKKRKVKIIIDKNDEINFENNMLDEETDKILSQFKLASQSKERNEEEGNLGMNDVQDEPDDQPPAPPSSPADEKDFMESHVLALTHSCLTLSPCDRHPVLDLI